MSHGLRTLSVCIPVPLALSCVLDSILFLIHVPHLLAQSDLVRTLVISFNESPYYPTRRVSLSSGYLLLSLRVSIGDLSLSVY